MLLTRKQNSVQNVYIITFGLCEIFIFYMNFTYLCTHFVQCFKNVQSSQNWKIMFRLNESNA